MTDSYGDRGGCFDFDLVAGELIDHHHDLEDLASSGFFFARAHSTHEIRSAAGLFCQRLCVVVVEFRR